MYEFWAKVYTQDKQIIVEAINYVDQYKTKPKTQLSLFQDYKEIMSKTSEKQSVEDTSKKSRKTTEYLSLSSVDKNKLNTKFEDRIKDLENDIETCYTRSINLIKDALNDYSFSKQPQDNIKQSTLDSLSSEEHSNLVSTIEDITSMYLNQFIRENSQYGYLDEEKQYKIFNTKLYSAIFNDEDTPIETDYYINMLLDIHESSIKEPKCIQLLKELNLILKIKD